MTLDETLDALARPATAGTLAACAVASLLALQGARVALSRRADALEPETAAAEEQAQENASALEEFASRRDEKLATLDAFRKGLPRLAEARRKVYEGGLQLQEEKRLLEKQLELLTTYILVDPANAKVHVMRGEQALETYALGEGAPKVYGDAKPAAALSAVISKERFAHPERPKSEQVNGQLQWEPPQVGESVRANALGEFVVFTRGGLIMHGPPKKAQEHAAFPHVCLELPLAAARRLYNAANIGTKVMVRPAGAAKPPPAAAPAPAPVAAAPKPAAKPAAKSKLPRPSLAQEKPARRPKTGKP